MAEQKAVVLKRWFNRTVEAYSPDTSRFLKHQKDPFSNPVGSTTHKGLEMLLDALLQGATPESLRSSLDPVIRIRAVQDFTAAKAVAFIFDLKQIVRKVLNDEIETRQAFEAVVAFEKKIDDLALAAFDVYVACREKRYQIQVAEHQRRSIRLLKRANVIVDTDQ